MGFAFARPGSADFRVRVQNKIDMINKIKSWWQDLKHRQQQRNAPGLWPENTVVVTLENNTISVKYPKEDISSIKLNQIRKIIIETNDSGPWGADFWYFLEGEEKTISFPQGATGEPELANSLMKLPRFNFEEFEKAMRSTENAIFLCWTKNDE